MKSKKWSVLVMLALVVIATGAWAGGYHYANRVHNQPPSVSSRITDYPNADVPGSLRVFLAADIAHADKTHECLPGYESYYIAANTATQAKLISTCNGGPFDIDAIMVNGKWSLPNISNQFPGYPIPLCGYVQKNQISKKVEPYCYATPLDIMANRGVPSIIANPID